MQGDKFPETWQYGSPDSNAYRHNQAVQRTLKGRKQRKHDSL